MASLTLWSSLVNSATFKRVLTQMVTFASYHGFFKLFCICLFVCSSADIGGIKLRDAWHIQNGWIFGKVPNGLWPFKRFYWIITTNLSSSSMRVELRTKDSDTSGWQPHLSSSSSSQSRSLMINGKNIIMISILITFTDVQAAEQTPVSENAVWPGGTFDNDGGGDYDNWWLLW